MRPTPPHFTARDAQEHNRAWGFNCGPAALAVIAGVTPGELRPSLGDFEAKGYTNPTMMFGWLDRLGLRFRHRRDKDWPDWGIVRVQFAGPWTRPGVPPAAAYRHTHWVGGCRHIVDGRAEVGVFDINCLDHHRGWVEADGWAKVVVPALVSCIPRADGEWWKTHVLEVERPATTMPRQVAA